MSVGSDTAEMGTLHSVGKKLLNLDADEGDPSDDEDFDQRAYKEDGTPTRAERDPDPDMGQTRRPNSRKRRQNDSVGIMPSGSCSRRR